MADGSVGAVVEIAGVDAVTGPGGTGGIARVDGEEGIDGLGAVQAVGVGLDSGDRWPRRSAIGHHRPAHVGDCLDLFHTKHLSAFGGPS